MKSYKIIVFVPLFALASCGKTKTPANPIAISTSDKFDTVRVTGTNDLSWQANGYKSLQYVDKFGNETDITFDVCNTQNQNIAYVERGDTIVVRNGDFIKNLTQERLKSEFVKSR